MSSISPKGRLLSERHVRGRLNVSRSTFWRMVKNGKFPKPFKITDRCNRWTEEMYEEFLASCGVEDATD